MTAYSCTRKKGKTALVPSSPCTSCASTRDSETCRYRWSLLKTLDFLNSRRPDLEIRAHFIHQLTAYENRLVGQGLGPQTSKWTEVYDTTNDFENEELLLRNTYLNARMGPFADLTTLGGHSRPPKVRWSDAAQAPLASVIEAESPGRSDDPLLTPEPPSQPQRTGSRNGLGPTEGLSAGSNEIAEEAQPAHNLPAKKASTTKPQPGNTGAWGPPRSTAATKTGTAKTGATLQRQAEVVQSESRQSQNFGFLNSQPSPIPPSRSTGKQVPIVQPKQPASHNVTYTPEFSRPKSQQVPATRQAPSSEPRPFQELEGQRETAQTILPRYNNYTGESKD